MKRTYSIVLTLALASAPLFAQHHGGGGGMGMGHDMSSHSDMSSHGNSANASDHGNKGQTRTNDSGKKSVSDLLTQNTKLSAKLQSLLPAGTNLQQAASGFKNLGQFVAAVHVSHNLGISFSALKTEMTGPDHDSLGQAIHDLQPAVNAKNESKKATKQAKRDIDESEKS